MVLDEDCPACAQLQWEGPERADFVLVPTRGGGWPDWGAALLRLLRRIGGDPTQVVIIGQQSVTGRYAQMLVGHGICHAEVSSNVYLDGDSRLSADEEELLALLGWMPPVRDFPDPEQMPANWTLPLVQGDWDGLVEIILATIVGVLGFDEHEPVEVETFTADHPCRDCFPEVPL